MSSLIHFYASMHPLTEGESVWHLTQQPEIQHAVTCLFESIPFNLWTTLSNIILQSNIPEEKRLCLEHTPEHIISPQEYASITYYAKHILSRVHSLFMTHFTRPAFLHPSFDMLPPDMALIQELAQNSSEESVRAIQKALFIKLPTQEFSQIQTFLSQANFHLSLPREFLEKTHHDLVELALDVIAKLSNEIFTKLRKTLPFCSSNLNYAHEILLATSLLSEKIRDIRALRLIGAKEQRDQIQKIYIFTMRKLLLVIQNIQRQEAPYSSKIFILMKTRRVELSLFALAFADPYLCTLVYNAFSKIQPDIERLAKETKEPPSCLAALYAKSDLEKFSASIRAQFGPFSKEMQLVTEQWPFCNQTEFSSDLSFLLSIKERTPLFDSVEYKEKPWLKFPELPSIKDLIQDFQSRPWSDNIIDAETGEISRGFISPNPEKDRENFLKILRAHNEQFCSRIEIQRQFDAGIAEKLTLPPKSPLYIRADMHSDLATVLGFLELYQSKGLLNKEYQRQKEFRMILLGDYSDRGSNDIEVLSLLLLLRMINPSGVFPLRGNHEPISADEPISLKDPWMKLHETEIYRCYQSFPVALCVGEKRLLPEEEHQYLHCSHAAFSTEIDLAPLLESNHQLMVIPSEQNCFTALSSTIITKSEKQKEAFYRLAFNCEDEDESTSGYVWADIGHPTGPSSYRTGARQISPLDVHDYLRAASGTTHKLKKAIHGHGHSYEEHLVPRKNEVSFKVIGVGLPVSCIGGSYSAPDSMQNVLDGFFIETDALLDDWTVYPTIQEGRGLQARISIFPQSFKLGESMKTLL